jgi:hypothetical protein
VSFVIIAHDDEKHAYPVALILEDRLEVADRWVAENWPQFPKSFYMLTVFKFVGRKPEQVWKVNLRPMMEKGDGNWPQWELSRNVLPPDYQWVSPT